MCFAVYQIYLVPSQSQQVNKAEEKMLANMQMQLISRGRALEKKTNNFKFCAGTRKYLYIAINSYCPTRVDCIIAKRL